MAGAMPIVEIQGVSKRYPGGDEALRDISIDIESGSFVVLLGPSGAGKSTLLRTINGLETTTTGRILVDGQLVTPRTVRRVRRNIGMIFQQFNLVGRLSVMTNILAGRLSQLRGSRWLASLFYLFHKDDIEIAHRALTRVGLTEKAWNRADRLSGGQQQRVGIARALAQQPRLILADEPVASLDPVTAGEIMSLLQEIIREEGITCIVTLHQVDLAVRYADRIIALKKGQLVFDGAPVALTESVLSIIYDHPPVLIETQTTVPSTLPIEATA